MKIEDDKTKRIELSKQNKILSPEDTILYHINYLPVEDMEYDIQFLESGKCLARPTIERKASKYQLGEKLKDKILRIPIILNVEHGNYKNIDRNLTKLLCVLI